MICHFVISYLQQEDVPERTKETLALWKQFEDLCKIHYTKLEITDEVLRIANQIIEMGILSPKSIDDCHHIATAVVHGCDYIISWNFKHIVNIKTIKGVRAITHLESYKDIDIMNPSVLLGGEE